MPPTAPTGLEPALRRLLLGLGLAAILAVALVGWLDDQRRNQRLQQGLLRPLPRHSAKEVHRLEINTPEGHLGLREEGFPLALPGPL